MMRPSIREDYPSDASVDYHVQEARLREAVRFTRAVRDQCPRGSPNYDMWHDFLRDDVARLNAHLSSRLKQSVLIPHDRSEIPVDSEQSQKVCP